MKQTLILGLVATALLSACAGYSTSPAATAALAAKSGSMVAGSVGFSEIPNGLRVTAQVTGLTPGEHGFHIHESGDCSAADGSSAKGHYNPAGKAHGHHDEAMHHSGDMPNLVANAQGEAKLAADISGVTLAEITGRSVVIHADPDDYKSQPAGNSGKRVACGSIVGR